MAWDITLVTMVRNLIGDTGDPPVKEDDRIKQAILTAGIIATQEYPFSYTYTFDFLAGTMTPDPTEPATQDPIAVALFALKAACLLSINDYQAAVAAGIRVRDGDSEVDTTGRFKGYSDIMALGPCAAYTKLLNTMVRNKGMSIGRAVLSPYSDGSCGCGPSGPNGIWHIRSFYDSFLRWW